MDRIRLFDPAYDLDHPAERPTFAAPYRCERPIGAVDEAIRAVVVRK